MKARTPRTHQIGIVTSAAMHKTIAVRVNWLYQVPKYGKRIRRHTTYYAHDEANVARVGDEVEIAATRPLSKMKRYRLVRVLRRAAHAPVGADEMVGAPAPTVAAPAAVPPAEAPAEPVTAPEPPAAETAATDGTESETP